MASDNIRGEPPAAAFSPRTIRAANVELTLESRSAAVGGALRIIVELLQGLCAEPLLRRLELALDEAIRNAYEHGNLGITSEEKEALCAAEDLEAELLRREPDAIAQNKTIRIAAKIENKLFTCSIEDDGPGFDWQKKLLEPVDVPVNFNQLNGRGLLLIRQIFDSVAFNERGNKLTVSKQF